MNVELTQDEFEMIIDSVEFADSDNILDFIPDETDENAYIDILEKALRDVDYKFVLKYLDRKVKFYYDLTGKWFNKIEYEFEEFEFPDRINGFDTKYEALQYVKAHPEIFTMKTYLYNIETRQIKKIKKNSI